ncbi:MAG: hypothetical protein NXI24_12950 [bacterium]|nr:hypothetical protein [bacterium]
MKNKAAPKTKSDSKPADANAQILAAWDLYTDGDWPALIALENQASNKEGPGDDIADLIAAARYEAADGAYDPGASAERNGLFGMLRDGMAACYHHEYAEAADLLGRWLLDRDYYAPVTLRRFIDAAQAGARYRLLGEVCKKFIGKPALQKTALEGFFLSNFHQDRHKEAVLIFEKFREQFDEVVLLQKAALSLMRLERYQEAEALLAPLHARLSGAEYQLRYEEVRESYSATIKNRATLAKKNNRSHDESMELGMAYLFSSEYDKALQIFQGLMKSQAA